MAPFHLRLREPPAHARTMHRKAASVSFRRLEQMTQQYAL